PFACPWPSDGLPSDGIQAKPTFYDQRQVHHSHRHRRCAAYRVLMTVKLGDVEGKDAAIGITTAAYWP
ncbi:MAG: hypothetical protein WCH75_00600, partial [Candidatus Binatia bacterium]